MIVILMILDQSDHLCCQIPLQFELPLEFGPVALDCDHRFDILCIFHLLNSHFKLKEFQAPQFPHPFTNEHG